MNNAVTQAILYKTGQSSIEEIDAMTLGFIAEIYDDEDRFNQLESDYAESVEESGLSMLQLVAIDQAEFELRGRKRVDDETIVEKHIGWMSWHESEQHAKQWIEWKTAEQELTTEQS